MCHSIATYRSITSEQDAIEHLHERIMQDTLNGWSIDHLLEKVYIYIIYSDTAIHLPMNEETRANFSTKAKIKIYNSFNLQF